MRQNFDYSCGAACVLALIDIVTNKEIKLHSAKTELAICKELKALPKIGIDNKVLNDYIKNHEILSKFYISCGVDTYQDGLCLANIRNFKSGISYYVVIMGIEDEKYRIFDPISAKYFLLSKNDFEWMNGSGTLKKWSINFNFKFPSLPLIEQKQKVFILNSENDDFNPIYDTVSFLYEQYFDRNYPVSRVFEEKIRVLNSELFINGLSVQDGDIVWLKIDPRQDESYFLTLKILSLFEDKINFYNPPSLLLGYDDKFLSLPYKDFSIINRRDLVSETKYLEKGNNIVLKRLNGFGGKDVSFFESKNLKEQCLESNSPYLIEHDISVLDNQNVDTRIFWFKGKYVGAVNRYSNGHKHCNMTQGGGYKSIDYNTFIQSLSLQLQEYLNTLSARLSSLGIVIAGVDVLNKKQITEVNLSNPSVYKNYIEDTGDNFLF